MMYCENCGKKLIRGYQFCMECGTPVPPEQSEDEAPQAVEAPPTANEEMPDIKPNSEEGTLVFCPTCGMRMQKSTEFCEKCGMKLGGNSGSVPLVNSEPLGGEDLSGMSDSDIAQINNFVNNSGFDGSAISYDTNDYQGADTFSGGNLNSEIEALNQQFANLNATASDMPAISAPVHEPEPEPAPAVPEPEPFSRRVEDFSMEAGMPETQFLSESGLPVINGGDMSEPDTPVDLEQHLGDITIDAEPVFTAPEPVYTAPESETPAYTEPESEPAAPAEETPAYTEPELSTSPYGNSEPVAPFDPPLSTSPYGNSEPETEFIAPAEETPAYTKPELSTSPYGNSEPAAPFDPPLSTSPYGNSEPETEPAAPAEETPAYTEPELSTSPYGNSEPAAPFDPPLSTSPYGNFEPEAEPAAPAEETPAYTEPELSTSPYGNSEPAAPFDPPLSTSPYGNSEPETEFIAPAEETPAYTEPELSTSPYGNNEPSEPISFNRPEPAPEPKDETTSDENADLGKLIYCRNCGQDMYENEPVCKNCGSPNKWNVKPLKKSVSGGNSKPEKEPFKLFGVISVPAIIGAAVVVVGAIVLIVSTAVNKEPSSDIVNSGNSVSFNSTPATSAPESDVNPVIPVTSESSQPEQTAATEENSAPASTAEVSATEDEQQPGGNESDTSAPDTSKPAVSRPAATTKPGTATKPNAAATKPAATTKPSSPAQTTAKPATTSPAAVSKPTATVSSEDKQRAKMLDAFETISAEVGKLHVYSQATLNALDEGKTRTYYTSGMTKALTNGKNNAANSYKNAEPSSVQFNTAYQSLGKLYDLYTDYYNYVTTSADAYDTYSSKESTKLGSFNSAVKSLFSYSKLQTENQTDADKSRTYAEIMTDASTAASNAVSKFSSIKTAAEKLKSGSFTENVMNTIYNDNTSSILNAAGYYQTTIGYYNILNSSVPSEYSSAKSSLSSTANHLENLLGVFTMAGENSLSGFKSDSASEIKSANSSISAINKAL